MVPMNIILYSLRAQGYVYNNGAYGSNPADARTFTETEAIAYMKRFVNHDGSSVLLPVNTDILGQVQVL